ncbi:MAG: hypothetical protein ABIO65_13445 [Nitrospiria bacterium]
MPPSPTIPAIATAICFLLIGGHAASAHEIVGTVTPLMVHMKRGLALIDHGKHQAAIEEIRSVYRDVSHDRGMEGSGLHAVAVQIDQRFGTRLDPAIEESIAGSDTRRLRILLHELAFLSMVEKFETLRGTFGKAAVSLDTQKTMFWLGRNYFAYLLEPALAANDPVEEQRLDRMLDAMLYRLEDGEGDAFFHLQRDLVRALTTAFHFDISRTLPVGTVRP